jgi:tRNA/rRNA methyltransferase
VVSPFAPPWREAKSAVGAPDLLENAQEFSSLAEALANCTFVAGTGTLTYRKPEQPVISLPELPSLLQREIAAGGRAALVFGPEKHGLTREDLALCHVLVEIPTDPRQPSMNLGQAVAVCLYELAVRGIERDAASNENSAFPPSRTPSAALDRLADLISEVMAASNYSPGGMHDANRHDLLLLLRRLSFSPADTRRALGLFRRVLWRLQRNRPQTGDHP